MNTYGIKRLFLNLAVILIGLIFIKPCSAEPPPIPQPSVREETLEGGPGDPEKKYEAARALHLKGVDGDEAAAEEALEMLEDLAEEEPENPRVLAYLGSAELLAAKRAFFPWQKNSLSKEGGLHLDRAVELYPADLEIRFVRGISSYPLPASFGRREVACLDFAFVAARALKAVADGKMEARLAAKALYYHGLCLEAGGQQKEAISSWEQAGEIAPGSFFAKLAEEKRRGAD